MKIKAFKLSGPLEPHTPQFAFFCPACGYAHWFNEVRWTWNRDVEKPTVSPSILSIGTYRCHSFVRDGQIEFLNDCDHKLHGQTTEIPDWAGLYLPEAQAEAVHA
jgi:hypothetical protein